MKVGDLVRRANLSRDESWFAGLGTIGIITEKHSLFHECWYVQWAGCSDCSVTNPSAMYEETLKVINPGR
jgi:hypothetical protein